MGLMTGRFNERERERSIWDIGQSTTPSVSRDELKSIVREVLMEERAISVPYRPTLYQPQEKELISTGELIKKIAKALEPVTEKVKEKIEEVKKEKERKKKEQLSEVIPKIEVVDLKEYEKGG